MGKSYGLELSSGPGKLQMPVKSQEELSKAASLQSQKLRREAQAWMGLEWERVGIICRSCACLCFPGSETLTGFSEGPVILKTAGLQPGGLSCRRGWLLRERLGRASGQAFVCLFPSVNTRKPHPVLQTDIQKSILNCRLGCSAGAKWLEAEDSVPRFRTPDRW